MKKLVVIGLQHTFLQMVYDQISALTDGQIKIRIVSFNELSENPIEKDETILYFSRGLKSIFEKMSPESQDYIYARRENLIYNMGELFRLEESMNILVVNDVKTNTFDMTEDLKSLSLPHIFFPYYPDEPTPDDIDIIVTAGEQSLVPDHLKDKPLIDIGLRFISLDTVYEIFDHFKLPYTHGKLARHYMKTMMMLSEKWPFLGKNRFRRPAWEGITKKDTAADFTFENIIHKSDAMDKFCGDAKKMALSKHPVHVYGKIGTCKTLIAKAIHNYSEVSKGPFVSINCEARTKENLKKELFGWEENGQVFKGLFETAENGTLCIEEIGKFPQGLQPQLLQAVNENKIIRCDGNNFIDINVRLITTNSQQDEERSPLTIEPDILLRMKHLSCKVPSLEERMDDIEGLVYDYIENTLKNRELKVPDETMEALYSHKWQGDVQELYNVLQHASCMSEKVLEKRNLPYYLASHSEKNSVPAKEDSVPEEDLSVITKEITNHGFLKESIEILSIYKDGMKENKAYGRTLVLEKLKSKGIDLTKQKLRLRLERLDKLGLLTVRPGRGGTTISGKGLSYLGSVSEP